MTHETESDPIIDEIHRTRERLASQFCGDIKAILEDARRRQATSGRPIWKGPAENKEMAPTDADGRSDGEEPILPPE